VSAVKGLMTAGPPAKPP